MGKVVFRNQLPLVFLFFVALVFSNTLFISVGNEDISNLSKNATEKKAAHFSDQITFNSDEEGESNLSDDCETEEGVFLNESECEALNETPSSSIDNGLDDDLFVASCCVMLLCFLLIAGTIIYYHSENEPIMLGLSLSLPLQY